MVPVIQFDLSKEVLVTDCIQFSFIQICCEIRGKKYAGLHGKHGDSHIYLYTCPEFSTLQPRPSDLGFSRDILIQHEQEKKNPVTVLGVHLIIASGPAGSVLLWDAKATQPAPGAGVSSQWCIQTRLPLLFVGCPELGLTNQHTKELPVQLITACVVERSMH